MELGPAQGHLIGEELLQRRRGVPGNLHAQLGQPPADRLADQQRPADADAVAGPGELALTHAADQDLDQGRIAPLPHLDLVRAADPSAARLLLPDCPAYPWTRRAARSS